MDPDSNILAGGNISTGPNAELVFGNCRFCTPVQSALVSVLQLCVRSRETELRPLGVPNRTLTLAMMLIMAGQSDSA